MSLRGSNGGRSSRSRASSRVLPPLRWLHGLARGHEVLPGVAAAAMAGHDVVERHVVGLAAAVLADVAVAREDLATRQLDPRSRAPDEVLEADDGGRAELRPRRPDHLVVVLDHFGLLAEQEAEGSRQVTDVQRLVVLVQNENDAVHRADDSRHIGSCLPRAGTRVGLVQARPIEAPVVGSQPPAWPTFVASGLAQRVGDEPCGRQDPFEATPVIPTGGIEEVDEVLGGEIAGGAGGVGAATGPAGGGVETPDTGVQPGRHVRERRAAGVVEVEGDPVERKPGLGGQSGQRGDLARDADPDRVAEADLVDAEVLSRRRATSTRGLWLDAPGVRTPERGRDVAHAATSRDPQHGRAQARTPPATPRRSSRCWPL